MVIKRLTLFTESVASFTIKLFHCMQYVIWSVLQLRQNFTTIKMCIYNFILILNCCTKLYLKKKVCARKYLTVSTFFPNNRHSLYVQLGFYTTEHYLYHISKPL